ncbi:C4-dicarboxylate transport transcriptional regulatory protein DctD [uncultured Candidatus Thioglobus sp.]|nr:C4-dicarboxylate transport transcriptional regulatory protein DctD [uncultured Candidatus Thioglobus sp.]
MDDTPGCLISDISMPEMNGIELLTELNKTEHARPTLFITGVATVKLAVEAMTLGAIDFIEKPIIADTLLDKVTKMLTNFEADKEIIDRYKTLTKREKQVYRLIIKGLTNTVIAKQIFLTISTVEKHRSVIMKKMKAVNLAALMADLPRLKLLGQSLFDENTNS